MKTKEDLLQIELNKEGKGNTSEVQFCYNAIFRAMEEYRSQSPYSPTREQIVKALRGGVNGYFVPVWVTGQQATAILKLMGEGKPENKPENCTCDFMHWGCECGENCYECGGKIAGYKRKTQAK